MSFPPPSMALEHQEKEADSILHSVDEIQDMQSMQNVQSNQDAQLFDFATVHNDFHFSPHHYSAQDTSLSHMQQQQHLQDEIFSTNDLYPSLFTSPHLDAYNNDPHFSNMINDTFSSTSEGKAASEISDSDSHSRTPKFDPKKLISPRTKRTYDALRDAPNDSEPNNDGPGSGQSSLLMKQFGVGDRAYLPNKKAKSIASDDSQAVNEKDKAKFGGGRSHGELGQYIKQKQDEGAAEAGPSGGIVDLTAEEDDDDLQFVHETRIGPPALDPQREVCMGTIPAKIMADTVPAAPKIANIALGAWPVCKMTLVPGPGVNVVIDAIDGKGNRFGTLELSKATVLSPLMRGNAISKFRVVAWLNQRPRATGEQVGQPISKALDCRITLYAPASRVTNFGRLLSQHQIFLSNPLNPEPGKEIMNPHVPNYKVLPKSNTGGTVGTPSGGYRSPRTVEEIRQDVLGMFDRLIKTEERPELEADDTLVNTELMGHQKQALHFLTEQETPAPDNEAPSTLWKPSIKKDGTKHWYNVISGHESRRPDLFLGGVFADMMGLGKTLSILARVCSSLDEARKFGKADLPEELQDHPLAERNTKGTLIVCPKSVLSNWDEQIKAHLNMQKIKFYVYHGPKRMQDVDELAKYDIVITAYTTVGSEHNSKSANYTAISRLNWYRVVLDEAHMIRNQDTNVFKAACEVLSKRRWAVTGTPIQNRLDDLGALVRFLKIYPFHQKGSFEKHFMAPFKLGDPQVISNLHLLVGSMTLRRSKDKIELPDRVETIVRLQFSEAEYALYEAFAKDSTLR